MQPRPSTSNSTTKGANSNNLTFSPAESLSELWGNRLRECPQYDIYRNTTTGNRDTELMRLRSLH